MKLEANLVPYKLWGFNARNIGKSKWEKIKQQARIESGYMCIICNRKFEYGTPELCDLHTHEFWEYKDSVAKIIKISTVCVDCHDIIHLGRTFKFAKDKKRLKYLNDHFIKVNKLEYCEYALKAEHIKAMGEWRARNKLVWEQDLSILENYGFDYKLREKE